MAGNNKISSHMGEIKIIIHGKNLLVSDGCSLTRPARKSQAKVRLNCGEVTLSQAAVKSVSHCHVAV
jgi:hypothetical protein